MADNKITPKEWFMKNFDKVAIVGVAVIIVVYFLYVVVHASPVKETSREIQDICTSIDEKIKKTPNVVPIEADKYLKTINEPFDKVPPATSGPAWACYSLPYIIKKWDITPIRHVTHPPCKDVQAEDLLGKIRVTFSPGEWKEEDAEVAGYVKFMVMRREGNGKWEVVAEFNTKEEAFAFVDEKINENTKYSYKIVSTAEITGEKEMNKIDSEKKESEVVTITTKFSFEIARSDMRMPEEFLKKQTTWLTVNKLITIDDRKIWVQWSKYYCVDPEYNGMPSANPIKEIKYYVDNAATTEARVDLLDDNHKKIRGKWLKVSVAKLDTGYDMHRITFDENKKEFTLTLKRRGGKTTMSLRFYKNKPVKEQEEKE